MHAFVEGLCQRDVEELGLEEKDGGSQPQPMEALVRGAGLLDTVVADSDSRGCRGTR